MPPFFFSPQLVNPGLFYLCTLLIPHQPSAMMQSTSTTLRRCAARAGGSQALKQHAQRATFASGPLEKTAYHQMHVDMKGKMVPFAGYELPVLYEHEGGGLMNETLHCRAPGKASVFDVSHMGQIRWTGKDAADFIEKCVVGDIKGLKSGEGRLTLITNADGGIVDDTVVRFFSKQRLIWGVGCGRR